VAETRAILFDLDDTLYPYQAFVKSGFRALARQLAAEPGLPARAVLRVLRRALAGEAHGREVQALCAYFNRPQTLVPALVATLRDHQPTLRLPRESAATLRALRGSWRISILTNGSPAIQRRKIAALGVADLVDAVMCAAECGSAEGKPAPAVFQTALRRLQADAERTVFVGDDLTADIGGARAVGMQTIHITAARSAGPDGGNCACGPHAQRLGAVPSLAERLVPSRRTAQHAW